MSEPNVTSHVPVAHDPSSKRRWWWWRAALPIGLLLALIAVAEVYVLCEPQYEASTLLEIHEHPQFIAFSPGPGEGVNKAFFRTQIELIRSRWILGLTAASDEVKQLPEIRKAVDPIEWLKKRVTVVQANGSNVFEIKYTGTDAKAAATIVNELTRQYLTTQEEEAAKSNRVLMAALAREMEVREKEVRALQEQLRGGAEPFGQRAGILAARSGRPFPQPAGRIAKPADRHSVRPGDAQGEDQGGRGRVASGRGSEGCG